MRILLFGGSGFVSRYAVKEAAALGYEVWYLTRGLREAVPGAHPIVADRNDLPALREAIRATCCRFDAVLDFICFSAEQARADLELLPEFTDRLIVISTDSLYHPDCTDLPRNEQSGPYLEDDSYGGKKRQMEKVFLQECPATLRWTLFRPPHMFGAPSELGCFPMHTRQRDLPAYLRAGKPIRLVGGGEHLIQPLYAGDMAKAAVAAVANPKTFNEIFCIAGPEAMPNRVYFETLAALLNLPVTIESVDAEEYRRTHSEWGQYLCNRVYDLSKLREAGLPVPAVTLREGLREQVDALLAQGR